MKIDACIQKISRYLKSAHTAPLLVDVQNTNDLEQIIFHFNVSEAIFVDASEFCNTDEMMKIPTLFAYLYGAKHPIFLTGLTSHLRFLGDDELKSQLNNILHMQVNIPIVLLTYRCKQLLHFSDIRLNNFICIVDGVEDVFPKLIFLPKALSCSDADSIINGINNVPKCIEHQNHKEIYVITDKTKDAFPRSIYEIKNLQSMYSLLCNTYTELLAIDETIGTAEQWVYLYDALQKKSTFQNVIDDKFHNHQFLHLALSSYSSLDSNEKWLLFIALKIYGAKNNLYLQKVIQQSGSFKEFIPLIFRYILEIEHTEPTFVNYYKERKDLLLAINSPSTEVSNFCNLVTIKNESALYYLTDNTKEEKHKIIALLNKFCQKLNRLEVEKILSIVYPDLYEYLVDYRFKQPLLNQYFSLYKYDKITNQISEEFEALMQEQSLSREFNLLLEPRATKISQLNKQGAEAYFVDALGVEYLSFILAKCKQKDLLANITIARANLPSITSCNKEFIAEFEKVDTPIHSIKELDNIKHHKIEEYDYQTEKLPLHLVRELEIIEEILDKIKTRLSTENYDKAIIVSDHGASRLAVIRESENKWQMASNGIHSGRCCPKSEVDVKSDYVMDADDYWVLANYDRFKGSRKANVEVHGGATLEEVVIPIIEITRIQQDVEVRIIEPVITIGFRKKAAFTLYVSTHPQNVSVCINNNFYDAIELENNQYLVEIPQIKKPQTYFVDVYANDNPIASNLSLVIKKDGFGEKDLL